MIIGCGTVNQTPLDWGANTQNILDSIQNAKEQGSSILCLPELTICGYGCEDLFLGDWLWRKCVDILFDFIIPETEGILVTVGLPLRFEDQMYNCAAVIKNKELAYIIPKQNLAKDGVHYEPRWFTPWPKMKQDKIELRGQLFKFGDYIFQHEHYTVGIEICEDAWRKERPAIELKKRGVNLILNLSASHFALDKSLSRQQLVIDSSLKYDCTYVFANLLGNEAGRMIYDGELLIAKNGKLLLRNDLLSFKPTNTCFWDDQFENEVEHYKSNKNEEFRRAVSLALFDYLRKSRSNGFVLSLSGGADSSINAILVSEMVKLGLNDLGYSTFLNLIGKDNLIEKDLSAKQIVGSILTTAYQATVNSGKETLEAAEELANGIGATFYSWSVDEAIESYRSNIESALGRKLSWIKDDIALQNIQSRARSPIIWMLANIQNCLLITTSNRSEGDVGYTTMDGDTSGSIAPIAAIDKPFIIQWLQYAQTNLGYDCLSFVNNLKPTAELRPKEMKQSDETDLMPYWLLKEIEMYAIKDRLHPLDVYKRLVKQFSTQYEVKLLLDAVKKFYRLWCRNQWKRERIAVSFHLDEMNVDPKTWCRFPVLSAAFSDEINELDNIAL